MNTTKHSNHHHRQVAITRRANVRDAVTGAPHTVESRGYEIAIKLGIHWVSQGVEYSIALARRAAQFYGDQGVSARIMKDGEVLGYAGGN